MVSMVSHEPLLAACSDVLHRCHMVIAIPVPEPAALGAALVAMSEPMCISGANQHQGVRARVPPYSLYEYRSFQAVPAAMTTV